MPDEPAAVAEEAGAAPETTLDEDGEFKPRGTMVIMLLFLALIAVIWFFAYFALLSRG